MWFTKFLKNILQNIPLCLFIFNIFVYICIWVFKAFSSNIFSFMTCDRMFNKRNTIGDVSRALILPKQLSSSACFCFFFFWWDSCCLIFSFMHNVLSQLFAFCPFLCLVIVLFVRLFTVSDYCFCNFKLVIQ